MNSSNSSSPIVLFDTTVLCGAIRVEGINRQLIKLAAQTIDYRVVISRVCLMEFMRNATEDGIGGVIYPIEDDAKDSWSSSFIQFWKTLLR